LSAASADSERGMTWRFLHPFSRNKFDAGSVTVLASAADCDVAAVPVLTTATAADHWRCVLSLTLCLTTVPAAVFCRRACR
jgi:hypothetical protein